MPHRSRSHRRSSHVVMVTPLDRAAPLPLEHLAAITCKEPAFDPSAPRGPTRRPHPNEPCAIHILSSCGSGHNGASYCKGSGEGQQLAHRVPLRRPYLTNTQPGCSSGKAIRPITAVALGRRSVSHCRHNLREEPIFHRWRTRENGLATGTVPLKGFP